MLMSSLNHHTVLLIRLLCVVWDPLTSPLARCCLAWPRRLCNSSTVLNGGELLGISH